MKDIDFCTYFDQLPFTAPSNEGFQTVLEDPGVVKIVHGFATVSLDTGSFVRVAQVLTSLHMRATRRSSSMGGGWHTAAAITTSKASARSSGTSSRVGTGSPGKRWAC
jgi:hypothetical protein